MAKKLSNFVDDTLEGLVFIDAFYQGFGKCRFYANSDSFYTGHVIRVRERGHTSSNAKQKAHPTNLKTKDN
ncbi:uncharacterized protein APUU_70837S [Aspergillus puulaauensis]|uniref:Uncharacterized protein n=1 Tax=Aspergillus puulaauensis TaxID=1220207 RepID=A0A7R7XXH5_9EURO|nr:uncharacterized protein APUU_70837S [Aspergillus puulaauensis]BCS29267.1 hypothetical protein APUU_70837S [Aspergillus puulaauensis]